MNAVETRNIAVFNDGRELLTDASLSVALGDVCCIVSDDLHSSTTMLEVIAGIIEPQKGEIRLFDKAANSVGFERVGMMMREDCTYPTLTAYDNLYSEALSLGIPSPAKRCNELIRLVGIESKGTAAKKMSFADRVRLRLALALVPSPDLLLLDEPVSGMGPRETAQLMDVIRAEAWELGVTVIVASQHASQSAGVATRYSVLSRGTIACQVSADEVERECRDSIVLHTTNDALAQAIIEESDPTVLVEVEPATRDDVSPLGRASSPVAGDGRNTAMVGESRLVIHGTTKEETSNLMFRHDVQILELFSRHRSVDDYFSDKFD